MDSLTSSSPLNSRNIVVHLRKWARLEKTFHFKSVIGRQSNACMQRHSYNFYYLLWHENISIFHGSFIKERNRSSNTILSRTLENCKKVQKAWLLFVLLLCQNSCSQIISINLLRVECLVITYWLLIRWPSPVLGFVNKEYCMESILWTILIANQCKVLRCGWNAICCISITSAEARYIQ